MRAEFAAECGPLGSANPGLCVSKPTVAEMGDRFATIDMG